jgi:hypothetical protein
MRDTIHDLTQQACATGARFAAVARAALVVGLLAATLAAPAAGAVSPLTAQVTDDCDTGEVTAAAVEDAERRAAARLTELRRLDGTDADVSRSVLASVQNHLEQGRLRAANEEYCAATRQFATARDQARAELTRTYRDRAAVLLNRSAATIADLEADGYHTVRLHTIDERIDRQRARLAAADSYTAAQAVHGRAVALADATAALPSERRFAMAGLLGSPAVLMVAVLPTLVGVVLGWLIRPRLSWSEDRLTQGGR